MPSREQIGVTRPDVGSTKVVQPSTGGHIADALMARIATAARAITWTSDETWRRVLVSPKGGFRSGGRRAVTVSQGLTLRDGEIVVDDAALTVEKSTAALRVAVAAADRGAAIERHSLERLAAAAAPLPDPWPAGAV